MNPSLQELWPWAIAAVALLVAGWSWSRTSATRKGRPDGLPDPRLREVLDALRLVAVVRDREGRVTYANGYALELLGQAERDVVGQDWLGRFTPEAERDAVRRRLPSGDNGPDTSHERSELTTRDGPRTLAWDHRLVRDEQGRALGHVSVGVVVEAGAETATDDGLHDALTGLPSRGLFMDRLGACLARAVRRPDYRFAALLLNLDRFKVINDSLGHRAGDALLVEVATRLAGCLRPGDSVARLGGDEFAILIDEMRDDGEPSLVAARVEFALREPFVLDGREVFVTASIGTALHKDRYSGPDDFLRDADTALHHAKAQGNAHHAVFHTGMHARALALLQLEQDLRRAVEREELSLHYQPIVRVADGSLAGFEALARWQRPGGEFVPPLDFIRLAEETGLILPLGSWVLREACRQLRAWQVGPAAAGATTLTLSVNLSPLQFAQKDLVEKVAAVVVEHELAAGSLKLEVTESALMREPAAAAAMLRELQGRQIGICLDDFGTGYSSLSQLLQLPVQVLKLDQSFVSGITGGREHALVGSIVTLAHNLGMEVVAEGVETREQLARLKELHCDFVQGYLLSKPLAADDSTRMVAAKPLLITA